MAVAIAGLSVDTWVDGGLSCHLPILPFSSAMPDPLWVAMCTSSWPSQQFSLLMQLLRMVSSGCQAHGQVSTPCPVLEGTARTSCTRPSQTRSRPGREATGGAGGEKGGRCALLIGRTQSWDTRLQGHTRPGLQGTPDLFVDSPVYPFANPS